MQRPLGTPRSSRRWAVDSGQWTVEDQRARPAGSSLPADCFLPVASCRLPSADCRLPGSALRIPRSALAGAALAALLAAILALPSCARRPANRSGGTLGGCAICHAVAASALAHSKHAAGRVTCVTCHGPSRAHLEDENNTVKPDRVFSRQNTDAFCLKCHRHHCPHASAGGKTCAECHGAHGVRVPPAIKGEHSRQ